MKIHPLHGRMHALAKLVVALSPRSVPFTINHHHHTRPLSPGLFIMLDVCNTLMDSGYEKEMFSTLRPD